MAQQRAQRQAALQASRQRLAETRERMAALQVEAESFAAQLNEAASRQSHAEAESESYRSDLSDLWERKVHLQEKARLARDKESRVRTTLESAGRLLAERSSRLVTLTELQESGDGFYQGVRAVLKASKEGRLAGVYHPAVDLLTVPENVRTAVEVALGGSLQDIVCDTEAQAKAGIEWLKANRAGRATFLALPMLRPAPRLNAACLRGLSGLLGVGADLVQADERCKPVLELLLGRVVIAEDMDFAVAASRKLQGWSRIVTLQGELLTPGGALTGGSLQSKGSHLVGRKGEIDDLRAEIPKLRAEVERLAAQTAKSAREIGEIDESLRDVSTRSMELSAFLAARESDSAASRRDIGRLTALQADRAALSARLAESAQSLKEESARWESEIAAGPTDESEDSAVAAARDRARSLSKQRDEARSESVALEVEFGRLGEKRSALSRSVESLRASLAESEQQRAAKQVQRELSGAKFAESVELHRELERKVQETQDHLAECAAHLAIANHRHHSLRSDSFDISKSVKETVEARARVVQEMHAAELQIARLEVRLAQAVQRLLDEYGISQDEAMMRKDVEDPERSTVNEVARLRREVRSMGAVNTGAVEEYERLTERHDFLAAQREDMENAREALLVTIREIDDSTRGIFMETFTSVSAEFDRLFSRLFNGGSTRLVLTDPDDLLETGIEVIAQPPGKKPQHLSLLSGGERALTAVALLFAFLAVRPSPFCLLDEVDAPLDGPNVEKFIELVNDFSRDTQFLVITHNPTTMEASPRWYGVTMQEAGVSRILSYRVPESAIVSEPERELEMPVHVRK
jgi:chromosome segregation protein